MVSIAERMSLYIILGTLVKKLFFKMFITGSHLEFGGKMRLYHQINVRFGILVVKLAEIVSVFMVLRALFKKLLFQDCRH